MLLYVRYVTKDLLVKYDKPPGYLMLDIDDWGRTLQNTY